MDKKLIRVKNYIIDYMVKLLKKKTKTMTKLV